MIERLTLLGSSSGRNAGDAALISGIMDSIDAHCRDRLLYEIPTIRPEFIWNNYKNRVRPVSMLPWHGSIKMLGIPTFSSILRTDLSLIFDAILFDRQLYNPLFNFLSTLSILLPLAKKRGKKLGCYNVGAGPVSTPTGKSMLRDVCELMDFITVRDQDSFNLLRSIGVKNQNMLITADAALSLTSATTQEIDSILAGIGWKPETAFFAVNISAYLDSWAEPGRASMGKEAFLSTYIAGLNRAVESIGLPILFVCTQHHDVPVSRQVMQSLSTKLPRALVSNTDISHYAIKGILSRAALLYAMRLHAVILASSSFTPVIALPHQPKVTHYLKTLGLEEYSLSFREFSADKVHSEIVNAWNQKEQIRKQLHTMIPLQQARANHAAILVAALRKGDSISATIANLQKEPQPLVAKEPVAQFSAADVTGLLG